MSIELDMERAIARTKSYTGTAILALVLYWLFWPAGFIVNYIYMQEAKRMERVAGQSLPGQGCLIALFWFNLLSLALVIGGILLFALGIVVLNPDVLG